MPARLTKIRVMLAVLSLFACAASCGGDEDGTALTRRVAPPLQCDTSGQTIQANSVARVFRTGPPRAPVYYGCMRESGRVFRLARVPRRGYVFELPRLTGGYFAAHVWTIASQASAVSLWDLTTGRRSYWGTGEEDFVGSDLEVSDEGAVAWVTDWDEVWKADSDGTEMIGQADRRRKRWKVLARKRRTVSWRDKGSVVSYVLRGPATENTSRR